jgi:hypothetical protein
MTNFILKYSEATEPDVKKMTAVLTAHGIRVLDDSLLPTSALVEVEESAIAELQTDLGAEWNIYPEKTYRVPVTEKKIKK